MTLVPIVRTTSASSAGSDVALVRRDRGRIVWAGLGLRVGQAVAL